MDGDRVDGLGVVGVGAPSVLSGGHSQESGQPAGSRAAGSTNSQGHPSAERGLGDGHSLGGGAPSMGSTHRRRTSRELPWLSVVNPGEGLEPTAALPTGSGQHARGQAASRLPEREAALSPGVKLAVGLQQAIGEERYDLLAITYSNLQPLAQLGSPSEQQHNSPGVASSLHRGPSLSPGEQHHSLVGSVNRGLSVTSSVGSPLPSPTEQLLHPRQGFQAASTSLPVEDLSHGAGRASARRQLFAEVLGPKQKQEQQQPSGGAADWFIKAEVSPGQSGSPTPAASADRWSLSWEVSLTGAGAVTDVAFGSRGAQQPEISATAYYVTRALVFGNGPALGAIQQSSFGQSAALLGIHPVVHKTCWPVLNYY